MKKLLIILLLVPLFGVAQDFVANGSGKLVVNGKYLLGNDNHCFYAKDGGYYGTEAEYISFPSDDDINIQDSTFTWSFWMKQPDYDWWDTRLYSFYNFVMNKNNNNPYGSSTQGWVLFNKIYSGYMMMSMTQPSYQYKNYSYGTLLAAYDRDWVYWAFTLNDHTIKFYVNGLLKSTQTYSATVIMKDKITNYPLIISMDIKPYSFGGMIDNIKLYNRVLSDAEIVQDMTTEQTGCVFNCDFEDINSDGSEVYEKYGRTGTTTNVDKSNFVPYIK